MSNTAKTFHVTADPGDRTIKLIFLGIFAIQVLWMAGLAWLLLWVFGIV